MRRVRDPQEKSAKGNEDGEGPKKVMQRRENLEKVRIKWGPRPEESIRRWGRNGEDGSLERELKGEKRSWKALERKSRGRMSGGKDEKEIKAWRNNYENDA